MRRRLGVSFVLALVVLVTAVTPAFAHSLYVRGNAICVTECLRYSCSKVGVWDGNHWWEGYNNGNSLGFNSSAYFNTALQGNPTGPVSFYHNHWIGLRGRDYRGVWCSIVYPSTGDPALWTNSWDVGTVTFSC